MYTTFSYIFYSLAVIAGYMAAYDLLIQIFPDFGLLEILVGFVATAMFFPLIPVYAGFTNGEWLLTIICFGSIFLGVILGNHARKNKI
tara:strand:- start:580 stop:843 length:264 start_codon:yes stop_codon:yes gene_type:complete